MNNTLIDMAVSQNHSPKLMKPGTTKHVLYDFVCMKFYYQENLICSDRRQINGCLDLGVEEDWL